jgi:large subunit ribosomal protein L22
VAEAYVGKNLIMKRFHARGRGRSGKIVKPFSMITVVVREKAEDAEADKKAAKKAKSPKAAKETA